MYHIQTRARSNSRKFSKTVANFGTTEMIKTFLKDEGLYVGVKPYFFTHIPLMRDGETKAIVTQTVQLGANEVMCSPVKLYEELTA